MRRGQQINREKLTKATVSWLAQLAMHVAACYATWIGSSVHQGSVGVSSIEISATQYADT